MKIPEDATPEEKIDHIVSNTTCVLRISVSFFNVLEGITHSKAVPTRNTSYTHLRDGFIRALQARMTAAIKDGSLSVDEAEEAQSPFRKLKSLFPNTPLTKGTPLDIIVTSPLKNPKDKRVLIVRDLGSIENNWIAK